MRIYLPEGERDAPAVICSELPYNEGSSVTYSAEQIAAEVVRYHKVPAPLVWIEHYPPETTYGRAETFELVIFSSYEVMERAPYMGKTKLSIGEPNLEDARPQERRDAHRAGCVGSDQRSVHPRRGYCQSLRSCRFKRVVSNVMARSAQLDLVVYDDPGGQSVQLLDDGEVIRVLQVLLQALDVLEADEDAVGVTSGALAEVLTRREVHDARDRVFEVPERGDQIV
jgi:hypothetical protein